MKMLSAGKVREGVSALLEHSTLFSVSQEIFNQNPQNVPSSVNLLNMFHIHTSTPAL